MELDLWTYWEKLKKNKLSSLELCRWYLQRIGSFDGYYRSIIEINPDALFIAEAMDRELAKGRKRSELHGVPILLKDNISTSDSLHTSAGSLALKDNFARKDAFIVEALRRAGAVILAKTNMTELSHYTSTRMAGGYSARGGQVKHAYNDSYSPSGSSSGSAVALAQNFALLAIGTETKGSIIWPSNNASIVGIKPSRGLVSRSGILPISRSYDTAGPMARTVADTAHLLTILAQEDQEDPSTWALDEFRKDYGDYLDEGGLKGMRLGIKKTKLDIETQELFKDALTTMEEQGAVIVGSYNLPELGSRDQLILSHEYKRCLESYLKDYGGDFTLLEDLISYNKEKTELKYGQDLLEEALELGDAMTASDYLELRTSISYETRLKIENLMDREKLDLLIFPGMSGLPSISGLPSVTVPCGYLAEDKPLGLSFIARLFDEASLIRGAYSYERASRKRKLPISRKD